MQKIILFSFVALSLVSGCSKGALGVKESVAWHHTASTEVKRAHFAEECKGFGYVEGTANMNECIESRWINSKQTADKNFSESSSYRPETKTNNDNALQKRVKRLESEKRQRDYQCIINGGVPSGAMCLGI